GRDRPGRNEQARILVTTTHDVLFSLWLTALSEILCKEPGDEDIRPLRLRQSGIRKEPVIHAVEQKKLRFHVELSQLEMALNRAAHIGRARSREEERRGKGLQDILGRRGYG